MEYNETFRAPPNATAAEIRVRLVRDEPTDRTGANLKVDAASFDAGGSRRLGPTGPRNPDERPG